MNRLLHDAAWHERMYNNRALVPDHGDYLRRWTEHSAEARRSVPCALDLAYGSAASETLDVFPAAVGQSHAGASVLVFIHGGYWVALDKSDHSFVAPAFVQADCCVVVVNYALCPGTPDAPVSIPFIVEQMERALGWVRTHIAEHGGAPARVTVAGHSAGGQLAAMLLARGFARNALSISGLHDLEPLMHTPMYQALLRLSPAQVKQASPCRQPAPAYGELRCAVGGDESTEFLRQNQLLQDAWGRSAVPECVELAGLNHFSVLDTLAAPGLPLHAMALDLLHAPT